MKYYLLMCIYRPTAREDFPFRFLSFNHKFTQLSYLPRLILKLIMASKFVQMSLLFPLLFSAVNSFSILDVPVQAAGHNIASTNQLPSIVANGSTTSGSSEQVVLAEQTPHEQISTSDGAFILSPDRSCCGIGCPPGVCGSKLEFLLPGITELSNCCLLGQCPPLVCGSRFRSILPELQELRSCCQAGQCPPRTCGNLFQAFSPEFRELTNCCTAGTCPPLVCGSNVEVKTAKPKDLISCCRNECPPGVCGGRAAAPSSSPIYIPIIALTHSDAPATLFALTLTTHTNSFISATLVQKLNRQSEVFAIPSDSPKHIAEIDGSQIPITHAVNLTIIAGKDHQYLEQTFEVVDSADQLDVPDVIVGTNFLTKTSALAIKPEFLGDAVAGIPVLAERPNTATEKPQQVKSEL